MKLSQTIRNITLPTLLILSAGMTQAKKEKNLITNGEFSKYKLEMWLVGVTNAYGQELDYKVTKKTIRFKEITEMSPKYVTLGQYVEIEKGKAYEVSFDTMTSAEAKSQSGLNFNIGRPGFARINKKNKSYDHARGKFALSTDWTTTKLTFTGVYDTDNRDYAGRKVKGIEEKKIWKALENETKEVKAPTWLVLNIGGMAGDLHIRNVVIKEISKEEAALNENKQAKEDKPEAIEEDGKELSKEEKKAAREKKKIEREKKKAAREAKKVDE